MGVTDTVLSFICDNTPSGFTFAFLLCLLVVYSVQYALYVRSLPPGPNGIPVFGSLFQLDKLFHLKMLDYAGQYGRLVSVRLGSQLLVLVNDEKLLKKMFGRSEFTARPKSALDCIVEGYGLITAEGALWQSQRRFLHKHKFGLKVWGNLGEQLESRVSHEVLDCMNALAADCDGAPLDPAPYLACSVSNVICSIIMSTRFQILSDKFSSFCGAFEEGFRLFRTTGPTIFLPWLKRLPQIKRTCEKLKANRSNLLDFVGEIVQDHKDSLDVKAPRDLVDYYLMEIQRTEEEGTTQDFFHTKDPETQLKQILLDLFSAGFETVKTTLLWTLIHVLRNPEVKAKVQEELERVVGGSRLPGMADMTELNYSRAVIYESMRRTHAVPLGTTHSNNSPVIVEGFTIPANSHVIPNLHALNMSPDLWAEPEEFNPERFLDAEGKLFKPKHFLPFGAGQRMCLGDNVAETELQLFFTSIMHVFDLEPSAGGEVPSLEGDLGATFTPHKFNLRLIPRNVEALIIANTKEKPTYSQLMRTCG